MINSPIYFEAEKPQSLKETLASHATLAAFAIGIVGSTYLAYATPNQWWASTLSIGIISLHTLPNFLHVGNPTLSNVACFTHLTALSCLLLGGVNTVYFSLSKSTFAALKTNHFSSALFHAFLFTGLLGYITPFFHNSLKNAYNCLHHPEIKNRLLILSQQFHHQEGLKDVASHHLQCLILQLSLFNPEFILEVFDAFAIPLPHYAWLMAATISESTHLKKLTQLLNAMGALPKDHMEQLSTEAKDNYLVALKIVLKSLKEEDASNALQQLIKESPKLIPTVISDQQFLHLLKEHFLEKANASIEEFLVQVSQWGKLTATYQTLVKEMSQLITELDTKKENLIQRYESHHKKYEKLRQEVEKIFNSKHYWQNFGAQWKDDKQLPFKRSKEFLAVLHNQALLKEIDEMYKEVIGTKQGAIPTIHDQFQLINNKLHKEDNEEASSIFYLATHCGFIQSDYQDLQQWLGVDSPHDLEISMEKIGLATKEDLIKNMILSHGESKLDIRKNLYHYIEKTPKQFLMHSFKIENEIEGKSLLGKLIEKVSRFLYYAISSGLILIPFFINPYAGVAGFSLGSAQTISHLSDHLLHVGVDLRPLLNRRVFSFSKRREKANHFASSHLYEKTRMVNKEIFVAFLLSFFSYRQMHVSSLIQGIAFSREIQEIFENPSH